MKSTASMIKFIHHQGCNNGKMVNFSVIVSYLMMGNLSEVNVYHVEGITQHFQHDTNL